MEVFWDRESLPSDLGPTAVTIGNFDGVHRGHQAVLAGLRAAAAERELTSLAITFDPHPALIHQPASAPAQICGLEERLARISLTGIDAVLVQQYSEAFARQSAEDFVRGYLVRALGAKLILVGHDVRFGWQNTGDLDALIELGRESGVEVIAIDDIGNTGRYSSTEVRRLIREGEIRAANDMLGSTHVVTGTVVHGDARGRDLGFPTANVGEETTGVVPADGVYAGWVVFNRGEKHPAAISVGTNPTFEGCERRVEAHVIDRNDADVMDFDVYGQSIRVEFVDRIRGQVAFDGLDPLIAQMTEDVEHTRAILAEG